jgi:hypothetical protein
VLHRQPPEQLKIFSVFPVSTHYTLYQLRWRYLLRPFKAKIVEVPGKDDGWT